MNRVATVFMIWLICSTSFGQSKEKMTVAWMLERTCKLNRCSAVVLPPAIDRQGTKHWFAISAAHCAERDGKYQAEFNYPPSKSRAVPAREIYKRRGNRNPDMTDVLIVELFPKSDLPYAEFSAIGTPKRGMEVYTTGVPNMGKNGQEPDRQFLWKKANILGVRDGIIEIDKSTWRGNSGGPLWLNRKVTGVSSTSDFATSAHFSDIRSVHEAYHYACKTVNAVFNCPNGKNCPIHEQPQPQPSQPGGGYQPAPNEDIIQLRQIIDHLSARIVDLENVIPQPPISGPPGPGVTSDQLQDIAEVVWRKIRDNTERFRGNDGKDGISGNDGKDGISGEDGKDGKDGDNGNDGKDGKDGIGGANGNPGDVDVVVKWEDGTVIGNQVAAQSGGTVIVTLSKKF